MQLLQHVSKSGDAAAMLAALEKKLQEEKYICYWMPNSIGQREVIQVFDKGTKVLIIRGGNRSGKTELNVAITIAWALGKDFFINFPAYEWVNKLPIPEPPVNIWLVGLDYNMVRDVLWGEKLMRGGNHPPLLPRDEVAKLSESEFWIQFKNGSRITCKSADSGRV